MPLDAGSQDSLLVDVGDAVECHVWPYAVWLLAAFTVSSRPSVSSTARSGSNRTVVFPCSTKRTNRSETPARSARSDWLRLREARRARTLAPRDSVNSLGDMSTLPECF